MTMAPADEHAASERRARDQAEPNGAWAQSAKLAFRFLFLAVAVTAIGWGVSNVRQVPPDSRAVVLRFGNIVRQQGAGLLIAWPRPIEEVVLLPSADRQIEFKINRFEGNASFGGGRTVMGSVPFGGQDSNGNQTDDLSVTIDSFRGFNMSEDPRQNAGFLLTGDSSVVHLQATLFYQITDPAAYLIAADHVAPALERLFVASAVSVCASRDLDTILVARPEASDTGNDNSRSSREQLRADLMNAVNQRLQNLMEQGVGLGITVSRVDLVPAIPSGAKSAFDLVLIATQWAERDIAQARTDAETTAQKANRESDRIITDATAQAEEVVTQAKTRTAAIAALAEQTPGLSGQMLINRIYYDRVGALLKKAGGVDTVDHDGTSHLILPGPVQK